jgi:hypothetical protein
VATIARQVAGSAQMVTQISTIFLSKLEMKQTKESLNVSPIDLCYHKRRAKADTWKDVGAAEKRRNARDKRAATYHNVIHLSNMQPTG